MAFRLTTLLLGAAAASGALSAVPASAINIVLRPDASFGTQPNGTAALYAFQKAANFWNKTLTNDVTLNFNVSYRRLGENIIGSTGSNGLTARVSDVYAGLQANNATALDAIAVANLRPLSKAGGIAYRMPDSVTGPVGTGNGLGLEIVTRGSVLDNDDSWNNIYMSPNTANAKVLGVKFDYAKDSYDGTNSDASITFSSAFSFDFDPTDGIGVGQQDFISVAIHEMGHALGFVSGADTYDFFGNPNGPGKAFGNTFNFDGVGSDVLSVWDLFRYSNNGGASGFDLATGKRYLQLDPNRGAQFSIDAVHEFTSGDQFSNLSVGRYNGDGQQASHWKEANGYFDINNCFIAGQRQIGIMDPTSGSCQLGVVTAADLAAFDAMGYNLNFDILGNRNFTFDTAQAFSLAGLASVPEPTTWAMMIGGLGLAGGAMRRRRAKVRTTVSFA